MMAHADDERVMLTLAALTYRGFHDLLGGRLHEGIVSGAVLDGLQTLVPVKDEWELVWGPATDRDPGQIVDSNAMYVVRSRPAPHRFVVAIRGTNPISLSDWVFGDFWVGEMVDWPYATATEPAAVSKSTALGLAAVQTMRSRAPSARSATDVSALVSGAFGTLARAARSDPGHLLAATPAWFESQVRRIAEHVQDVAARAVSPRDRRRSAVPVSIAPADLRPGSGSRGPTATLTCSPCFAPRPGAPVPRRWRSSSPATARVARSPRRSRSGSRTRSTRRTLGSAGIPAAARGSSATRSRGRRPATRGLPGESSGRSVRITITSGTRTIW